MRLEFWKGKRVLLTGHTGFKGGWLALCLTEMGAEVHGYALAPPTDPSFFTLTRLADRLAGHCIQDIRDGESLLQAVETASPDIVFHLAAQPLVRESYRTPVDTYAVNVMGTVHLLEAVRHVRGVRAVVVVTSDKCYENRHSTAPARELDPMGGQDPYAGSKACAELVTQTYRRSFLDAAGIPVASARAGNVIGGGDWAADRLVPDFLRALDIGEPLAIRWPSAVRPWQHVLEPLSGYLRLAQRLHDQGRDYAEGWNFGPDQTETRSVQWIVEHLCAMVPGSRWRIDHSTQPPEHHLLILDSAKARDRLGWQPRWNLATALRRTLEWHNAWRGGEDMLDVSLRQIALYETEAPGR